MLVAQNKIVDLIHELHILFFALNKNLVPRVVNSFTERRNDIIYRLLRVKYLLNVLVPKVGTLRTDLL